MSGFKLYDQDLKVRLSIKGKGFILALRRKLFIITKRAKAKGDLWRHHKNYRQRNTFLEKEAFGFG